MGISLCMITKNEEEFLAQCLDRVSPFVDEIVLVDTGSTDHTCEIALHYGAKTYHQTWERNFSKARNYGLERAKENWILFLDADELLENGEKLNTIVEEATEENDGFIFEILNYSDDNKRTIERSHSLRLFRNKPELRFSGAIHEQLPIEGKIFALTEIRVHHYGYMPSIAHKKNKSKRNLEILQEEIRKEPNDPFNQYNLGNEYLRFQQREEAIQAFQKSLNLMKGENGYESRLYKLLSISLLQTKKFEEGLQTVQKGIEKFPYYPDLYFIQGLLFEGENDLEKALASYTKCTHFNDEESIKKQPFLVIEDGMTSFKSFSRLGRVNYLLGRKEQTLSWYCKAIKASSTYREPFTDLVRWYENNIEELINSFDKELFSSVQDKKRLEVAQTFFDMNAYYIVIELLKRFKNKKFDNKKNRLLSLCYFKLNNFKESSNYFSNISSKSKDFEEIIPFYTVSLWLTGKEGQAKQILGRSQQPSKYYLSFIQTLLEIGLKDLIEANNIYPSRENIIEQIKHYQFIHTQINKSQ